MEPSLRLMNIPGPVSSLYLITGDSGLELYQSWGIANKDLTLQNIWDKFEEHCKPQANELRAPYDLHKKLKQTSLSCDQFFTAIQNQLSLCQYPTETHNFLERDIFLFGLSDQTFMSKNHHWWWKSYYCWNTTKTQKVRVVRPLPNTSPAVMAIMQE